MGGRLSMGEWGGRVGVGGGPSIGKVRGRRRQLGSLIQGEGPGLKAFGLEASDSGA
jgi:hypothetical protein